MEKVFCCPNCKSVDYSCSPDKAGALICNNCELEFATEETLTNKINLLNKVFSVISFIAIITLIIGTIDMSFFILMDNDISLSFIPRRIMSNDRIIGMVLCIGVALYVVFFISLYTLIYYRKKLGILKRMKKYVKKYGYKEVEESKVK